MRARPVLLVLSLVALALGVIALAYLAGTSGVYTGHGTAISPGPSAGPGGRLVRACADVPHRCGFPDATNTGVPPGTRLTKVPGQMVSGPGWTYDPHGAVVVNRAGVVLSGLDIQGQVSVTASHVTIRDVRVVTSGPDSMGISLRRANDVTIEHSTISGTNTGDGRLMVGVKDVYGDAAGTRVLDDNISRVSTGVQVYQGLIQGNYIHDLGRIPGDHINGVTTNGDTRPLMIQHNTIFNRFNQTDAIGLFQDFGVVANVTIDDNLLAGGGYTVYAGAGSKGIPANIRIIHNRISSKFFGQGGHWGPLAYFGAVGPGNVWSGNVWDSTGQLIRASQASLAG